MRLVFLGSPPFALPVLERVLASAHAVLGLVTRPDKPQGRGRRVETSPLAAAARERGLPLLQPRTTKDPAFVAELAALEPEVLLVASYGEILRADVLELAPHGALNVHASLLPRHRGASPIQAAILAGDAVTGVSIQRMVLALDEGDVLLERETPIGPRETAGELFERLARLGGEAAVEALDRLAAGTAHFTPQDPARATYARRLAKDAGTIDWTRSARELDRHVRAMTPWPGAHTTAPDGKRVTVLEARPAELGTETPSAGAPSSAAASGISAAAQKSAVPESAALESAAQGSRATGARNAPGTLLETKARVLVATGDGALELVRVKPEGKAEMDAPAWLRGARLEPGAVLGEPRAQPAEPEREG